MERSASQPRRAAPRSISTTATPSRRLTTRATSCRRRMWSRVGEQTASAPKGSTCAPRPRARFRPCTSTSRRSRRISAATSSSTRTAPRRRFQALPAALTSRPSDLGGQQFLNAQGSPLTASLPPAVGDGISSASGRGGAGGVADFNFPAGQPTGTATVTAYAGDASTINAAGSVTIASNATTSTSAYGDTRGGGGISVGKAFASDIMTAVGKAYVGDGASITAGDDFVLTAHLDHNVDEPGCSFGGGLVSGKIAQSVANLTFTTETQVGTGATVTADNAVMIHSTSRATANNDTDR